MKSQRYANTTKHVRRENEKLATFLSFGGLGWKKEDRRDRQDKGSFTCGYAKEIQTTPSMYIKKWKVGDVFEFLRARMEDGIIREGDKILDFTCGYDDVIGSQIWGLKMAMQKLAILGEQESFD